jgi:hypothetical protein
LWRIDWGRCIGSPDLDGANQLTIGIVCTDHVRVVESDAGIALHLVKLSGEVNVAVLKESGVETMLLGV